MKNLKKSVSVISQMLDLLIGDNSTISTLEVMKQYPYLPFGF